MFSTKKGEEQGEQCHQKKKKPKKKKKKKTAVIAYAKRNSSGEPALPLSLARTYAIRSRKRLATGKPAKELDMWPR